MFEKKILTVKRTTPQQQMLIAVTKGNLDFLKVLLQKHAIPCNFNNNALLFAAVENDHLVIVKFLLDDPNINPAARNNEILIKAILSGNQDILKLILDKITPTIDHNFIQTIESILNINSINDDDFVLFLNIIVCSIKNIDLQFDIIEYIISSTRALPYLKDILLINCSHVPKIAEWLLQLGADPTLDNCRAVSQAIICGQTDLVKYYLELLNFTDLHWDNYFNLACEHGHLDLMELFRDKANTFNNDNRAFSLACKYQHLSIVQQFFKLNIAPPVRIIEQAISYSCEKGYLDIVKCILSFHPANNDILLTSFNFAFINHHSEIMSFLMNNYPIKPEESTFYLACESGNLSDMEWVLQHFIPSKKVMENCLYHTLIYNQDVSNKIAILNCLLTKQKFSLEIKQNLFLQACWKNQPKVIELLLNQDINPCFNQNETLRVACQNGTTSIIILLVKKSTIKLDDVVDILCKFGHLSAIQALIDLQYKDINDIIATGDPLSTAAYYGHIELTQFLLTKHCSELPTILSETIINKQVSTAIYILIAVHNSHTLSDEDLLSYSLAIFNMAVKLGLNDIIKSFFPTIWSETGDRPIRCIEDLDNKGELHKKLYYLISSKQVPETTLPLFFTILIFFNRKQFLQLHKRDFFPQAHKNVKSVSELFYNENYVTEDRQPFCFERYKLFKSVEFPLELNKNIGQFLIELDLKPFHKEEISSNFPL